MYFCDYQRPLVFLLHFLEEASPISGIGRTSAVLRVRTHSGVCVPGNPRTQRRVYSRENLHAQQRVYVWKSAYTAACVYDILFIQQCVNDRQSAHIAACVYGSPNAQQRVTAWGFAHTAARTHGSLHTQQHV